MRPRKNTGCEHRCCENCTHFYQHYVSYVNGTFRPCHCGHCYHPRLKHTKPDWTCELFQEKSSPIL